MSEQEHTPQAARRLREFGRRRVDDDAVDDDSVERSDEPVPPAAPHVVTTMAPGSLWGPATAIPMGPAEPAPSEPEPARVAETPRVAETSAEPDTPVESSRRGRRSTSEPQPDAVNIDDEQSHDWWAKRDDLDTVVNPKKRGAAARAQRAAREAFAPAGTTNVASGQRSASSASPNGGSSSSWNPSDVYSWQAAPTSEAPPPPPPPFEPPPPSAPTPWDVLGLTSEATWTEVSRRHKQLAKRHHPDRILFVSRGVFDACRGASEEPAGGQGRSVGVGPGVTWPKSRCSGM